MCHFFSEPLLVFGGTLRFPETLFEKDWFIENILSNTIAVIDNTLVCFFLSAPYSLDS